MSSFEEDFEPYRASDAHDEMDARFGWGLRNNEVHHLQREREILRAAICQVLAANGHLADGDVCTLLALKVALRKVGAPWEGDELCRRAARTDFYRRTKCRCLRKNQ